MGGGRLSRSFGLAVGPRVKPGELAGYHVDFSVKATAPRWPPSVSGDRSEPLWVDLVQWGLGCYERHLAGEGTEWLEAALRLGDHLVERQSPSGAWLHHAPYHTFELVPPWSSGMAQGEAASLLARLHRAGGRRDLSEAAIRALEPLYVRTEDGGVLAPLGAGELPEEYPTSPPSYVLNGAIFALWGLYDVATGLGDERAGAAFERGVETLAANLGRWDNGYWSRYDLYPHPVVNVASPAYHELHIQQLRAFERICPRAELRATRERWEGYGRSRLRRGRALAAKVAFRLRVPKRPSG